MTRTKRIEAFAEDCAEAAQDADLDAVEVADPLPGDWDALQERFGPVDESGEETFRRAYRERLRELTGGDDE